MAKKLLLSQVIPIILASGLAWLALTIIKHTAAAPVHSEVVITAEQVANRGVFSNFDAGDQPELNLMASLNNKNQLTIFGSSEFTDSPFCPYFFLPDSLGIPAIGIGHAHHQSFSILCELLAANEYVEGANICVIVSPAWFHTPGTNTEAFVEFVRPNFLNRIAADTTLARKYKIAVGKFIDEHSEELSGFTKSMNYLRDEYLGSSGRGLGYLKAMLSKKLKAMHPAAYGIQSVKYEVPLTTLNRREWSADRTKLADSLRNHFLSGITNNKLYVYDEYYIAHMLDSTGKERTDSIKQIDLLDNPELEDFRLLVDFLVNKSANCSFVIQPVNPYYYQYPERNLPLIDTLTSILDRHNLPYLNMYAANKSEYVTGVLKDVMHLGDYGWMQINYFLEKIYDEP